MQVQWKKLINEINTLSESYLLCVSGGVDSMFLLDFFAKNAKKPFRVAHFNHQLRDASLEEMNLVKDTCDKHGIDIYIGYGDPEKMRSASSLEAEARNQRYAFFSTLLNDTDVLVTAHHANDQLETVLLRLMRGYPDTNLRMHRVQEGRYKPFLQIPKSVIIEQAEYRRVKWMEDESNHEDDYERNWVRNVIIPEMMTRRNVLSTIALNKHHAHGIEDKIGVTRTSDPETFFTP